MQWRLLAGRREPASLARCGIAGGRSGQYARAMASDYLSDLMRLSVSERIQLAQDLWDSVEPESDTVPLSEAQRRELLSRSEAHQRRPHKAVPLEDALERIERSLG